MLSNAEFVRVWGLCHTLQEFCQKTGMSSNSASTRAHRLRGRGYTLKKYPHKVSGSDDEEIRRAMEAVQRDNEQLDKILDPVEAEAMRQRMLAAAMGQKPVVEKKPVPKKKPAPKKKRGK